MTIGVFLVDVELRSLRIDRLDVYEFAVVFGARLHDRAINLKSGVLAIFQLAVRHAGDRSLTWLGVYVL